MPEPQHKRPMPSGYQRWWRSLIFDLRLGRAVSFSMLMLVALGLAACLPPDSSTSSLTAKPELPNLGPTAKPESPTADSIVTPDLLTPGPTPAPNSPVNYTFRIVDTFPHDPDAFTQGLIYESGFLYEGTGLRGQSTLRKVDLNSGEVLQSIELEPELFGEGIAASDGRIFQLTLTSGYGFVYDQASFEVLDEFAFTPEGWGLTFDGESLIMSDGSSELRLLDPETYAERSRLSVTDDGVPVVWLNELEWVEGEIFANVWQSDAIARISPVTGEVLGWIDLEGLRGSEGLTGVLNGIAYDVDHQRLFVTGKNWPQLFEIKLIEIED